MSFIKEVINESMDIWNDYLTHPFVKGIENGDLDIKLFENYIIQDSIYLKEYARVFALGMYKSKKLKDLQIFYKILSFVESNENSTRAKYLKEFNITDDEIENIVPRKETQDYIDFMINTAENHDVPEILMAVLPCMFSYCYIFREVAKNTASVSHENKYWDFINDYISERYLQWCLEWGEYTNNLCIDFEEERKKKLIDIFRKSSEHEMKFWDMSNTL